MEEEEITIEDLLNLEEEAVKKPFSMDKFFDKNPNLKPVDPRVQEGVIVRDNPSLLDPVELQTKVGKITEDTNYDATEDPEESDFYIQTQKVVSEVDNIIQNPVTLPQGTITALEAAGLKDTDIEDTREIDVEATTNKINEELKNSPSIIEVDPIQAQYAPNKIIDGK